MSRKYFAVYKKDIMARAHAQRNSIIVSTENNINNRNDRPNGNAPKKNEYLSSTFIDDVNDKNVNSNGKIFLEENPVAIASSSSSSSSTTTDTDVEYEQEPEIQEEQESTNNKNHRKHPTRREKYFRKRFKSEIADGMPKIVDCFLCAYQGDILLQGQIFITDRYLCFYSRIINHVTKHVHRWEQIECITKERVAYIFPTAIGIKLKKVRRKIVYASFLSRDMAYDTMISIWSQSPGYVNPLGDNENYLAVDKRLKLRNKNLPKYLISNARESVAASEPDEISDIYLNVNNSNRRRVASVSPRLCDGERKSKTVINSTATKSSDKNLINNQKQSNQVNGQNSRLSRFTKQQQSADNTVTKRGQSLVTNNQMENASQLSQSSQIINQTVSLNERTVSHQNSSSPVTSNSHTSITSMNNIGISGKLFNITVSFISLFIQTLSSLLNRFPIHPTKTMTLIILIITLIFFHSFYLIALAYRLEHRLQILHNRWPSSLVKNS